ncbi:MAG: hypothetical protein K0R53_1734 [Burkholderiales bacterium]|nr:hypothetical protein [Burkholderiales bacterium]
MEGAARGLTSHEGVHHGFREMGHLLPHARRSRALPAVHRDEGLGHGDRDLGGLEHHHAAIPTDHLVLRIARLLGGCPLRNGEIRRGCGMARAGGELHMYDSLNLSSYWNLPGCDIPQPQTTIYCGCKPSSKPILVARFWERNRDFEVFSGLPKRCAATSDKARKTCPLPIQQHKGLGRGRYEAGFLCVAAMQLSLVEARRSTHESGPSRNAAPDRSCARAQCPSARRYRTRDSVP